METDVLRAGAYEHLKGAEDQRPPSAVVLLPDGQVARAQAEAELRRLASGKLRRLRKGAQHALGLGGVGREAQVQLRHLGTRCRALVGHEHLQAHHTVGVPRALCPLVAELREAEAVAEGEGHPPPEQPAPACHTLAHIGPAPHGQ